MVLLRELAVAYHGSELIALLALATWLLGSGLGAIPGSRRGRATPRVIRIAFLAQAILVPASVVGTRSLRSLLGATPGAYLSLEQQLLAMATITLPLALLAGLLFRLCAQAWLRPGRSLARAYAIESLGALAGGVLSTGLVLAGLQDLTLALLCGLLSLGAACLPGPARGRTLWVAVAIVGVPLVAALLASGPLDRALTRLEHPQLVISRDTPYGRVTVDRREQQLSVFLEGALVSESQGVEAELFVHPAALQVRSLRRVLVVGGAAEGLLEPLLQHDPERIDLVEIDGALLEILEEVVPAEQRTAMADSRVRFHVEDPRRFVEIAGNYDLVLLATPEPTSAATSRTYTAEFLRSCADRLNPGGALALRLPGAENLWTPTLTWRNASIHRAVEASFDDVLVLPGTTNTWIAARGGLERTPTPLALRMETRGLETQLVSAAWLSYQLANDRTAEIDALLAASTAPLHEDARPVCYPLTLLLWLGRFDPTLALQDLPGRFEALRRGVTPVLAGSGLVLALLALIGRRWTRLHRMVLALLAGLLGTTLECVLLLGYQIAHGVLWGQLGLLLGAFMAGLAGGALAVDVAWERKSAHTASRRRLTRAVAAGAFVASGATLASQWVPTRPGLVGTALLLALAGASAAAIFAVATRLGEPDQGRAAGPLWAVDLVGGCVGTLLATLVLVPLLGLGFGAVAGLVLALAGVLLLA